MILNPIFQNFLVERAQNFLNIDFKGHQIGVGVGGWVRGPSLSHSPGPNTPLIRHCLDGGVRKGSALVRKEITIFHFKHPYPSNFTSRGGVNRLAY